jgi:hypothetical protein
VHHPPGEYQEKDQTMRVSKELRVITCVLVGLLVLPSAVMSDPVAAAPPVAEGDASSDTSDDPAEILVKYKPSGAGDAVADFESVPLRQRRARLNREVGAVAIGEVSESLVEVVRLD